MEGSDDLKVKEHGCHGNEESNKLFLCIMSTHWFTANSEKKAQTPFIPLFFFFFNFGKGTEKTKFLIIISLYSLIKKYFWPVP